MAGQELLLVIVPRLGRGRTRHDYGVKVYTALSEGDSYPKGGVDVLVRTASDFEKAMKTDDLFVDTLKSKGKVLYERPIE